MKKILSIAAVLALSAPFAAFAADANAGVQINAVDSSGKTVHVETTYEDDGSPVFHLDSSGGASAGVQVGGGSEEGMEHAGANENAQEHMSATATAAIAAHVSGDAQDSHVKNVEVKGDEVNFDYVGHGKFLGVFDLDFTSKVHVMPAADGTVSTKVDLPWWSFLISGAGEVKNAINAVIQANASAGVTAE